jgi:hypothetical protein
MVKLYERLLEDPTKEERDAIVHMREIAGWGADQVDEWCEEIRQKKKLFWFFYEDEERTKLVGVNALITSSYFFEGE